MIVDVEFEEAEIQLDADFGDDEQCFDVEFEETESLLDADFGEVVEVEVGADFYKGDYAVTPKVAQQVLPTKDKFLVDDMTINPVPIFQVSNTSGGNTVYIAEEM